ncbi:hypothetical protein H310_02680 [Aphanomyces invadans]|uniref:Hexose transporter 1 n=1 Tax=Aphanomyces invadans TaxID=157072 RepID=A0A024UJV0_9STRA|nr:hypothetical protein H310_02680 [Aphanomyces invadans]ETW06420.1 hypothetical protein H310_02680 [Aphanomyces invadans]RHY29196.1 hypothetical protein DYB32_005357 [Aphanomyces invadans]|eukprot:XP_008864495.1 hypothetical protein H310_02680 [Aphanomyces invadans]
MAAPEGGSGAATTDRLRAPPTMVPSATSTSFTSDFVTPRSDNPNNAIDSCEYTAATDDRPGTAKPRRHKLHRGGHSYRNLHRTQSRGLLTRLESFIHPDHAKSLAPTRVLYLSVAIALVAAFQSGWLLSQLNYLPFNAGCGVVPIAPGTCIMFAGHSKREWTMAVTAWIVGAAIGAGLSGYPADKIGRKQTLRSNVFIMATGATVQVISHDIYTFSVGRLISGIASGTAINVSNVLISEISPCEMRGLFSTGIQAAVSVGSLCVTTAHYAVGTTHELAWRVLVGVPIGLAVAQLLLMPWMAQSPVWLVSQGKLDDATIAMKALYQPTNFKAILHSLVAGHADESRELAGVSPWNVLFSSKFRRQLVIAVVLCMAQQLGGINAIMYYSASIFNRAGVSDPRIANTVVNVIRTTAIITAAKIMDKFRRKTLLVGGMSMMAASAGGLVVSLVYANAAGSVVCVCVYIIAYCVSIGSMAWMVSAELFPDFLKADAGSVGTFSTWVSNFSVGVFYPLLADEDALGNYAFCIFIGCLVVVVSFVLALVPETANKTYAEIEAAFGIAQPHDAEAPLSPGLSPDHDPWITVCCDDIAVSDAPAPPPVPNALPAPIAENASDERRASDSSSRTSTIGLPLEDEGDDGDEGKA